MIRFQRQRQICHRVCCINLDSWGSFVKNWNEFIHAVQDHLAKLGLEGCDVPFFRGHADNNWQLLCGLGRQMSSAKKMESIERVLYYDFLSLGGGLLGKQADSWDVLFSMQHHGLPTRLLDWSTTFAAALYFALRPYMLLPGFPEVTCLQTSPCIWILNPFELNQMAQLDSAIGNPQIDFDGTYQENFIEKSKNIGASAVAIGPTQHTSRQTAQRSVFTLHADLSLPLDAIACNAAKKFDIPLECVSHAGSFLRLAGLNEFSVFPDLDGLARHLKNLHAS